MHRRSRSEHGQSGDQRQRTRGRLRERVRLIVTGDTKPHDHVFVAPTGKTDDREPSPGYRTWMTRFGLDPDQAAASPWADTDDEGVTNLAEFMAAPQGNRVLGRDQRYSREGATHTPLLPFTTRIALANPHPVPVPVRIEYALGIGSASPTELTLALWQRTTMVANAQPGLSAAEFGFRVSSTRPIGIDRTMRWTPVPTRGTATRGRLARRSRGISPKARPSPASSCSSCCRTRWPRLPPTSTPGSCWPPAARSRDATRWPRAAASTSGRTRRPRAAQSPSPTRSSPPSSAC